MPEFLLIDISNSFTKLSTASRERLTGAVRRIPTRELSAEAIRRSIGTRQFRQVVLSSVVPSAEEAVREFAATHAARLLSVTHRCELGVAIDYPNPRSIGADRLANTAGAAAFYGAPVVVVDFGTAVTFDVLARVKNRPAYVGGIIAPGLSAMTDYLHEKTALLPRVHLAEPRAVVGKSTREAMLAGAVIGYRGLVREILRELRRELKTRQLQVAATGGYAALIAKGMPEKMLVHPSLTLEGLRIIGNLNPA